MVVQVQLNDLDFIQCRDFAEECVHFFKSNGRSEDQKISNIVLGKLGEIAFLKMFNNSSEIDWSISDNADPGWDFVLDEEMIDVKTIRKGSEMVFINHKYLRADKYALIELDKNCTARLIDIITIEQIIEKKRYHDSWKTYYIPVSLWKN